MKRKKLRKSHQWPRDPLDWYVENEWCSTALFRDVEFHSPDQPLDFGAGAVNRAGRSETVILDPAAGSGRIVLAALDAGYDAYGSDVRARWRHFKWAPRSGIFQRDDFLKGTGLRWPAHAPRPHWIVTNPPFFLCWTKPEPEPAPFVARCLEVATVGCALLLPHDWIAGEGRSAWLERAGLWRVLVCVPRPSMPPGKVILRGDNPGGGEHNFAWYIFRKGYVGPWQGNWLRRDVSRETSTDAAAGPVPYVPYEL